MKSKLLPTILIILILLNVLLIFILIKKPHQKKVNQPERAFLSQQLNFSDSQTEKFKNLDKVHKEEMMDLGHQIRMQKDVLFNSLSKETINIDSLANINAKLEVKKELEIYNFFKSVRKICTPEQQERFDEIINKAIRGGNPGPPRREGNHPPKGDRMPPPPR